MDTDTNTKLRFELWKLSTSLSVSTGKLVSHKQSKAGPCVALVITNSNEAAGSYGIGVVNETSRDKLPDTIKATPTAKYLKVEADSKVADHAAVFEGFEDFKGFYFDVLQKVSTDDVRPSLPNTYTDIADSAPSFRKSANLDSRSKPR